MGIACCAGSHEGSGLLQGVRVDTQDLGLTTGGLWGILACVTLRVEER